MFTIISACKKKSEFDPLFTGQWKTIAKSSGTAPDVSLSIQDKGNGVSGTMMMSPCRCCSVGKDYDFSGSVNSGNVLNWNAIIDNGGTTSGTFKQTDGNTYELSVLYTCDSIPSTLTFTMEKQ